MNIQCSICVDLVSPHSELVATVCGHMFHSNCLTQWVERAKTCPHCRKKLRNDQMFKIFIELAPNHDSGDDLPTVRCQLDASNLEVSLLKKEVTSLKRTKKLLSKEYDNLKKNFTDLEAKALTFEAIIAELRGQVSVINDLKEEINAKDSEKQRLNDELRRLQAIKDIVTCHDVDKDVNDMIKNGIDNVTLATMVATLRKELKQQIMKRSKLKQTINELERTIREARTKNEIKSPPTFDPVTIRDSMSKQSSIDDEEINGISVGEADSSGMVTVRVNNPAMCFKPTEPKRYSTLQLKKSALTFSPSTIEPRFGRGPTKNTTQYTVFKKKPPASNWMDVKINGGTSVDDFTTLGGAQKIDDFTSHSVRRPLKRSRDGVGKRR